MTAVYIIIGLAILFIISRKKKKAKPAGDICADCIPLGSDAGLRKLYVYHNGIKVERNETMITDEKETRFTIKGFDIEENEVELKPDFMTWEKSCQVVKWKNETGLENIVTCSYKGNPERNVWVKYNNFTFGWMIQFK